MLKTLTLSNFALFADCTLEIDAGLTVITGETGAGKSLLMDALHFLHGKKPQVPRLQEDADVTVIAEFSSSILPILQSYLDAKQLAALQLESLEIIKVSRCLHTTGRSRVLLSDTAITIKQLQNIMGSVLRIHTQHAHLEICHESQQRRLLDEFGNYPTNLKTVSDAFHALQELQQEKDQLDLQLHNLPGEEEITLILKDLDDVLKDELDYDQLNTEHRRLQGRQSFLEACQISLQRLESPDNPSAVDLLYQPMKTLEPFSSLYPDVQPVLGLLSESQTLAQEAKHQLDHILDCDYTQDHEKLQALDNTLADIHRLARKYKQEPAHLTAFHHSTLEQQDMIHSLRGRIAAIQVQIEHEQHNYDKSCATLHALRCDAGNKLSALIASQLPDLNLPYGRFHIACKPQTQVMRTDGTCAIQFLFSANPGQDLQTLQDSASGGELARLALILQSSIPAKHPQLMVFDEADVGVSGKTAMMVGQLLRNMGRHHTVLCITHSPQVASCGEQHWGVIKSQTSSSTQVHLEQLSQTQHIHEVARLLSGTEITPETLANAENLCAAQREGSLA